MSNEQAWDYAIGIVQLDGIKPSDDFLVLVEKEKRKLIKFFLTMNEQRAMRLGNHGSLFYFIGEKHSFLILKEHTVQKKIKKI